VDEISESVMRNPGALISVVRLKQRDDYTYMHSVAVCALMVALGRALGVSGENLSLFAKMGAVCDVYDAVTSVRPYKNGWDPGDALHKMAQWKGHFAGRLALQGPGPPGGPADAALNVSSQPSCLPFRALFG
jgi:HD-GYP domain-containing protein (c-di-GMP phosphodiesterase class II)